jgi:SAM-dependent methyltransferase
MNYIDEWDAEHTKRDMRREPLEIVQKAFDGWDGKKVLDIGCGAGTNTIWLASKGYSVWGFDSSPAAIKRLLYHASAARCPAASFPHVIVADATKPWPYFRDKFDIVIDIRTTENFDTDGALFCYQQVGKVLRVGGGFLCLTASPGRSDKHTAVGGVRKMTDMELAELLLAGGLAIKTIAHHYDVVDDWVVVAEKVS